MEYFVSFYVNGCNIRSMEKFVSADSFGHLKASFHFDESWNDLLKTAIFRKGENAYHIVIREGKCDFPHEVLDEGDVSVSVFGLADGVRATTVETTINIQKSGYTVCEPTLPTPEPYDFYLRHADERYIDTKQIADEVKIEASLVKTASEEALAAKDAALISADEAERNALEVAQKANEVAENTDKSYEYSIIAADASSSAKKSANNAENTALRLLENHNNSASHAHTDIRQKIKEAESIARGKATSITFENEAQMFYWLGIRNLCPLPNEGTFSSGGYENFVITHKENGRFDINLPMPTVPQNQAKFLSVSLNAGTYTISTNSNIIKLSGKEDLPKTITLDSSGEIEFVLFSETAVSEEDIFIQIENGEEVTSFKPYIESYTRPDGKTVKDLVSGDNIYIVELGVPDYWWDGKTVHPLGAEKPFLSDYCTKEEISSKFGEFSFETITMSDYTAKFDAGEIDEGKIYFVCEG